MKNGPVVMIVEDEKVICDFLSAKLESNGYKVVVAATGQEAVSLASSHCPELVLLDLGLPDMDGMKVLQVIRAWSAVPIVIVSARRKEEDIVQALDNGADDYVTKPFSNTILMARIRTALRKSGGAATEGAVAWHTPGGSLSVDYDKRLVMVNGRSVHLTPIEYKILTLLAQNAGRVITYDGIRRHLWGPYSGDNRALRVNMANLRRKIEDNAADPKYILTEIGVGYRMRESEETGEEGTV